jgi:hypothetical protein
MKYKFYLRDTKSPQNFENEKKNLLLLELSMLTICYRLTIYYR